MNVNDDNFRRCQQLSYQGDWDSLNELMRIYLSAPDHQTKKDARRALQKAKNRKAVMAIFHTAIENAVSDESRLDLLFAGQLIYRIEFLYDYLVVLYCINGVVPLQILEDMKKVAPFSSEEMDVLTRYMIDQHDLSKYIYKDLDAEHQALIRNHIVSLIKNGESPIGLLNFIRHDDKSLEQIQESLKAYVLSSSDNTRAILPYIKLESVQDPNILYYYGDIFDIYKVLSQYRWDIASIAPWNQDVTIVQKVFMGEALTEEEWSYIKICIEKAVDSSDDTVALPESVFSFLNALTKIDLSIVESIYIPLYKKAKSNPKRILFMMAKAGIPFAYEKYMARLLSVEHPEIRRRTVDNLLNFFGSKSSEIYSAVLHINDDDLTAYAQKRAEKYGITLCQTDAYESLIRFLKQE